MNDTPITDFDKLKNTLIEIGASVKIEDQWCISIIQEHDCSVSFYFGTDGEYRSISIRDESYPDD